MVSPLISFVAALVPNTASATWYALKGLTFGTSVPVVRIARLCAVAHSKAVEAIRGSGLMTVLEPREQD